MPTLFMIFVYGFFFYLIFKAIRFFVAYMNEPQQPKKPSGKENQPSSRFKIKSEDIIDAEFEELKPEKKDNQKK